MKRFLSICVIFLLVSSFAQAEVFFDQQPPEGFGDGHTLRMTVFRTGEADAMLFQTKNEALMVDGAAYKWREDLYNALIARGITHVKYLISTHPHDDHIEGLRCLMLQGITAEAFMSPFAIDFEIKDETLQQRAVRQAAASGIPFQQIFDGDVITLEDATFRVYRWEKGNTTNSKSAMIRVEFGDASVLLCADITGESQHFFLGELDHEILKADIVKAPHHGIIQFVGDFLTVVDPAFMFITNFSNSGQSTAKQAKARDIPFLYSGDGTIYLETDGTDWYIYQTYRQF